MKALLSSGAALPDAVPSMVQSPVSLSVATSTLNWIVNVAPGAMGAGKAGEITVEVYEPSEKVNVAPSRFPWDKPVFITYMFTTAVCPRLT